MNYKIFSYLIVFLMVFSCLGNSFAYTLITKYPTSAECNGDYRYWDDGVYYGVYTSNRTYDGLQFQSGITVGQKSEDIDSEIFHSVITYAGDYTIWDYDEPFTTSLLHPHPEVSAWEEFELSKYKTSKNGYDRYNITDGNKYVYVMAMDGTSASTEWKYARIDTTNVEFIRLTYWDRGAIRNPHIDMTIYYNNKSISYYDNKNGDFNMRV